MRALPPGGSTWCALVLLTACGAGSVPVEEPEALAGDACGPRAMRLGDSCWSAEGTAWTVFAESPSGAIEIDIELLAAGRVRSNDHPGASPASDEWFLDGSLLRIFLGDRFVEYRAIVSNGTVLVGEAINVRGQRWEWRAERRFGELACAEGEARLERACMSVAGTRWQLAGDARMVELLAGGVVAGSAQDPGADRWTQERERVRFSLDEGARRFDAELAGDAELRGTYEGAAGSGAFTATRVESIPPRARR